MTCKPKTKAISDARCEDPKNGPSSCIAAGVGFDDGMPPPLEVPPLGFAMEQERELPYQPVDLDFFAPAGMRDSADPTAATRRHATLIQNAYPVDTVMGTAAVGRSGFTQAGLQLGGAANRLQCFHQYTQLDGTEYTLCVAGGEVYSYNWATPAWTDLTHGLTLDSTAKVYAVTFANKVIFSDGVNTPISWSGSAWATITNCPVLYGPPTVYYAKIFGIKNTERSAIVWSEENDETTGYEAGGYNNAWTLGQTDQQALYLLVGTNEALFYFRARSIGAISGRVTTDFVNSGTREGICGSLGTKSPAAAVYHKNKVYFIDADFRPRVVDVMARQVDEKVYEGVRETAAGWDTSKFASQYGVQLGDLALLSVTDSGDTYPEFFVAIDTRRDEIAGLWTGFSNLTAMGVVKNASGVPVLMHGTVSGYAYHWGTVWNDVANAADGGTLEIEHIVKGPYQGFDAKMEKKWDQLDVSLRAIATDQEIKVRYLTPRGTSSYQTNTLTYSASTPAERHLSFGLGGEGRWCQVEVYHKNGVERFGLMGWSLKGFAYGAEPEIP